MANTVAALLGPHELISLVEDSAHKQTHLELSDSAKAVFQQLTGPVYVVAMHEWTRSSSCGKSTNLTFFVREW